LALLVALLGLQQLARAAFIQAKAVLAPILIARAWAAGVSEQGLPQQGLPQRPWPWADTWPVARIQVPALGIERYVLAGTSGQALAFGPGLDAAGAVPGEPGTAVIAGHRDTHFRFLQRIHPGMVLRLQRPDGRWQRYRAGVARVVDNRDPLPPPRREGPAVLELVTCYPFDALQPGGPLRYVVPLRRLTHAGASPYLPSGGIAL